MPTATLFYGLTVTTSSLVLAADAFPRLEPAFLGVDHIVHKLRNGTLATNDNSGIEKLPVEIWTMVKDELVRSELAETDHPGVKIRRRCMDCDTTCTAWNVWGNPGCLCDLCMDAMEMIVRGVNRCDVGNQETKQAVSALLDFFGLVQPVANYLLPPDQPIKGAVSPIGLQSSIKEVTNISIEFDGIQHCPSHSCRLPHGFTRPLPSNVLARFTSLVKTFYLDIVPIKSNTSLSQLSGLEQVVDTTLCDEGASSVGSDVAAKDEKVDEKDGDSVVDPAWVVWCNCEG